MRRLRVRARWRCAVALMGLPLAAMLGGCSATTSRVSDDLSLTSLQKGQTGVAIMMMGIRGQTCPSAHVTLGKKVDGGYEAVTTLRIRNTWIDKGGIPQTELAAGTYHIVHWNCTVGRYVTSIGKTNKTFFGIGQKFLKSFASFTINPGEVVNLGYLRMTQSGLLAFVRFDVSDLPPQAHASLKQDRPKLYAQMTTRLMQVEKKPMTPEQRKAYCKLIATLAAITKVPGQTPADCIGVAADPRPGTKPVRAAASRAR